MTRKKLISILVFFIINIFCISIKCFSENSIEKYNNINKELDSQTNKIKMLFIKINKLDNKILENENSNLAEETNNELNKLRENVLKTYKYFIDAKNKINENMEINGEELKKLNELINEWDGIFDEMNSYIENKILEYGFTI